MFKITWVCSSKCNINCEYCFAIQSNTSIEKLENYYHAFRILKEKKIDDIYEIDITGGEPLIFPNIKKIISILHNLNYKITLNTNLLDEKIINIIHKYNSDFFNGNFVWLDTKLNKITYKQWGINASLHQDIYFNNVLSKKFLDNLKEVNSYKISTIVQTVVTPEIISKLGEISEKIKEINPFYAKRLRGHYKNKFYPTSYTKSELDIIEKYSNGSADNVFSHKLPSTNRIICTAGYKGITIIPNGDVYRCFGYYVKGEKPLGNLFKGNINISLKPQKCNLDYSSCFYQCLQFGFYEMNKKNIHFDKSSIWID